MPEAKVVEYYILIFYHLGLKQSIYNFLSIWGEKRKLVRYVAVSVLLCMVGRTAIRNH